MPDPGEDCDPGRPAGDNCCDPVSCFWVAAGSADPLGVCGPDGLFCNGAESCNEGSCQSSGDPCIPDECDEDNDRCASCGDGVVNNAEQCDPAPPRSDHCCDPATCNRVPPASMDPQGVCSGPGECRSEVCTIAGNCRFLDINEGSPCTSDGLYCTGSEFCSGGVCVSVGDPCLPRACYDDVDACSQDVWYGLGGSEFGPWTQTVGGPTWGGGVSQSYSSAMGPHLALNSDGHPVLVWIVAAFADSDVYAKRFNGFRLGRVRDEGQTPSHFIFFSRQSPECQELPIENEI